MSAAIGLARLLPLDLKLTFLTHSWTFLSKPGLSAVYIYK